MSEVIVEEPVRIFSDLHLGHPGSRIHEVEQLRSILVGAKTVIFNGDTFEERAKRYMEKAKAQLVELKALCADIGAKPIFITGNHDPISPPNHYLDLYEGHVFVTHGDALYEEVSPWSTNRKAGQAAAKRIIPEYTAEERKTLEVQLAIAKRVAVEMEIQQTKAKHGLSGKLASIFKIAWPPHRPFVVLHVWLTCHKLAHAFHEQHRPKSPFMVIGHTHRPYIRKKDGRTVINTGAFLPMSNAWAADISDGQIRVLKIGNGGDGRFQFAKELARMPV
ncbi:MAG: metallophosphoesterase family protein [Verrucomicrobiota bacterium]